MKKHFKREIFVLKKGRRGAFPDLKPGASPGRVSKLTGVPGGTALPARLPGPVLVVGPVPGLGVGLNALNGIVEQLVLFLAGVPLQ